MRYALIALGSTLGFLVGLAGLAIVGASLFEDYALCIFLPVCEDIASDVSQQRHR